METITILGTGMVGRTIGSKLIQLGYKVMMGSRSAENEKAVEWAKNNGPQASNGTYAEVMAHSDLVFNCTRGAVAPEVFTMAGLSNFNNKIIIDVSDPLDFSNGMPPSLIAGWCNTNSLGEEIQKLIPGAKVVKTLNMVNCEVMVDAGKCGGEATMFMCGNDEEAKGSVRLILEKFGWKDILDMGDITASRGMEMLLPIWLRTWVTTGNAHIGFKIVR